MSPSIFQFSISTVKLVGRHLLCFTIICSPLSLGGSNSVTGLVIDDSNRILSKAQILWVLYSHELLSTFHVTDQSAYFVYLFYQAQYKFERISGIQQLLIQD